MKNLNISADEQIKSALTAAEKDFKATLFADNVKIRDIKKGARVTKIELDLEGEV